VNHPIDLVRHRLIEAAQPRHDVRKWDQRLRRPDRTSHSGMDVSHQIWLYCRNGHCRFIDTIGGIVSVGDAEAFISA